jgi:uncharacterized surface protein with fasciclin (FAS1) repeats
MPATLTRGPKRLLMATLAASVFVLAACSDGADDTEAAASTSAPEPTMTSEAPMEEAMMTTFGEGCAAVPEDGAGSFAGMAEDPVATAASNNPVLSTLVTAATEANLVDTLNGAEDITVFAPTDDAFGALPKKTLKAALADPDGLLTTVLTYHVVGGRLAPEDLAGEHETLQGESLMVEGEGESFTVNGNAAVICGNVQTANATVYIIDQVLLPPSAA